MKKKHRALGKLEGAKYSTMTSSPLNKTFQDKRLKNQTIEFLKLAEQIHDDKNFIFSSQSKFGFTGKLGYNFQGKKFNRHTRGIGNNRIVLESLYSDRNAMQQVVITKNEQTSRK